MPTAMSCNAGSWNDAMMPVHFPEANARFLPPPDMDAAQCETVEAFMGPVRGGSLDGARMVVTAWKPTDVELALLQAGHPIFLTFIGGLPPHYVSLDFQTATHPA